MIQKKYYLNILLLLFLFAVITSCDEDEEDRIYSYPTDVTLGIMSGYGVSIDPNHQDWKVEINNPEIIDVTMDENSLNIIPKKLGATRFLVFGGNNEELFRVNVEVVVSEIYYSLDRLSTIVEVIDESYKEVIEKEMEDLYPHAIGTTYVLTYYTRSDGELSVHPAGGGDLIKGTFYEGENDSIVFRYNGLEQHYLMDIVVNDSKPQPNIEDVDFYFIKDYTLYFRDKYPEAGVFRVKGQQITKLINPWKVDD
ncbi:MAG: pilus assembly protein N-terminal domain-containing protein [Tannerella sp.]|jgi:hypothetical protein|nr:pilus assembly protein N-terminal domain-containing protein [Tannerella sp.]